MNEFIQLRARARSKRDKLIAQARKEYAATLVQIAVIEQDLLGKVSTRYKKISAAIESVIPREAPFTTVDVMAGLEALDPGRVWRKRSIDNHISRLRERGLVRRLKRHRNDQPALYARVGVSVPESPFPDMTLPEAIRVVLTRPMNQTEIVVALFEAGYETTMTKKALRDAVGVELRKNDFEHQNGRWLIRHPTNAIQTP